MGLNSFRATNCSPIWGANYLEFEWSVPQTGLQH